MNLDASLYIANRKISKTALIDKRICEIISYVVDCYLIFKQDKISISKDEKGKITQEDYFRNILVDDYLRKYRHLIRTSTTEIKFNREATETYADSEGVRHDDKIDIHISDSALQKSWNSNDDIYYAIECKRIKVISNTTEYVKDIEKFTERKYSSTRLPFEGQIAFVENGNITYDKIIKETNKKLTSHNIIKTNQYLTISKIHTTFEASYLSSHIRNLTNEPFTIHHLFFDYSNVLMN